MPILSDCHPKAIYLQMAAARGCTIGPLYERDRRLCNFPLSPCRESLPFLETVNL